MKTVVDWLLARRAAFLALVIAFALTIPPLATALIALQTAHRGPAQGVGDTLLTCLAVSVAAFVLTGGAVPPVWTLVALGTGLAMGAAIRRFGSLALVFQLLVLVYTAALALVPLLYPDLETVAEQTMDELLTLLSEGGVEQEQLEVFESQEATLLGWIAGLRFLEFIVPLLLAFWWLGLARAERSFGAEFRALRLGLVLGAPAAVVLALNLVFPSMLVQNASIYISFVFLFQGLAVLHALAHAKKWHPMYLIISYVFLVPPLTRFGLLVLSSLGVVDTVFNLRARFGRDAQ